MSIRTLYIDSSVIGGYFDVEWQEATRELWSQWRAGKWRFVTSTVTAAEMLGAPPEVRDLFEQTFPAEDWLEAGEEVEFLAEQYLAAGVVPRKYSDDARHVASCLLGACLVLVSWNFRHLANVNREAGFNAVNLLQGRPALRIVSPLELIYENETEDL
jgi:predicted nucleic acid-binding protein